MNQQNTRYVIAFDPAVYSLNKEDPGKIPDELKESLENSGALIAFYSGARSFVSAYIPRDKVEELRKLEGIIGVAVEPRFDVD
ncbi:MAG: hypothetical protein KKA62_01520 [Nanoarchaeota archaeon]|nr:hypothetical protein [Nanoarchaeota archaeon]MBU1643609.1 hypothetical protein [Nanoarchaeota archaeon]MBU1976612.1 hypothetical protein [Nanoarchaeota archaeon]